MSTQPIPDAEETDEIQRFLDRHYHEQIADLVRTDKRSVEISLTDLYQWDPDFVDDYISNPHRIRKQLDQALHQYPLSSTKSLEPYHIRVVGWDESDTVDVGGYSARDIGGLQAVSGQVAKVTEKKPVPNEAKFECLRCGTITAVPQSDTDGLEDPYECDGCERDGPYEFLAKRSEWENQQQIRIQQPPEEAQGGQGSTVDITVSDDLVNRVHPGDRATVAGALDVTNLDEDPQFHIEGHSIELEDSDYDEAAIAEHREKIEEIMAGEHGDPYELLKKSIAPRIHGEEYEQIKLALGLQMFAANQLKFADGGDGRGRFHILILGDPGVGKSRLVEAVDELAPRSVFTSGEGVSKAGLTAAVVPDDFGSGKWSLEAGPIVKANEGICAVDEIDKASEEAVEGLHTALEKQIVSVSKASFSGVELQAKTSLLAAGNPRDGRFDPFESPASQIDLSPTLLSRFDLMFLMADNPDEDDDPEKIERIIRDRQEGILVERGDIDKAEAAADPPISPEVVRAWVAYIHERNPKPVIQDEQLRQRIKDFVTNLRLSSQGEDMENKVPVTFRKVEAIMRLAEASARVRASETVEEPDVERAVQLVLRSMRDVEYDPETGTFDADIVETGQSRAQQQRNRDLKDVITDLAGVNGEAKIEEIYEDMESMGYTRDKISHEIKKLKDQGEIYESSTDAYRVT